jgi:dihydroorotase
MKIIIKEGHIIDPARNIDGFGDVIIEDGRITGIKLSSNISLSGKPVIEDGFVIYAKGLYVLPGLVDMHTHLREPGFEHKETIETGTDAAVRGGFTAVCCMPNTKPVNDSPEVTSYILNKAKEAGSCKVFPIGAVTKGQLGSELVDFEALRSAGCVAFSDDGRPVMNSLIMRKALEYSKSSGIPIISHCEDSFLAEGGVMNEGRVSESLGLKGIPAAAEEVMIARDIILAGLTGGRLHIAHVSTKGSVELIRRAKNDGIAITAETCPHYFSITDEAAKTAESAAKVNPPLRTADDVAAIKKGLRDGTIDVIATDHAPHHKDEKILGFDKAPFGISGLETALGLSLGLFHGGILTIGQIVEKMAINPSRILGLDKGALTEGSEGDILIMDADKEWVVRPEDFYSMGHNTPFAGRTLKGRPVMVISGGEIFDMQDRKAL